MTYLKAPVLLSAFGDRVRTLRKKKSMTQEDLAHKAGIAVSHIGRIERGSLNPGIRTIFLIAEALEAEPKELLEFNEAFIKKEISKKK
jgi:transcriptional regulator with XRE-family HTH domain